MRKSNLALSQEQHCCEQKLKHTTSLKLVYSNEYNITEENKKYYIPKYAPSKTMAHELQLIKSELLLASSPIIAGLFFMFACMIETL